jgi:2,3-bisphosphoglycerate-independent phosphoglycerate mutase
MYEQLLERLAQSNETKILLTVLDGLGGLPSPDTGKTELEVASKPAIDDAARGSALGLLDPVAPGITPGSGPAHLALFGYDPVKWDIGRGILSALGIGFQVGPHDMAARGNYATVDDRGVVLDRRAGRISTELNREISQLLEGMKIGGTEVFVRPEKEHRVAVIFRGGGLSDRLTDSDPQAVGVPPNKVEPTDEAAAQTADVVNKFLAEAGKRLASKKPANALLLRGFARHPRMPSFDQRYKLRACAIASYPMYKGLARLVGMDVVDGLDSLEAEVAALERAWSSHDFFYFHYKYLDSRGEDGDFAGKVKAIEEFDRHASRIFGLGPDVLALTGDHSTPSILKMHSWHPVPLLLRSRFVIPDGLTLSERNCARGNLGRMRSLEVMPLLLANARRLEKYGA